jgi:hypothetical protein
MRHNRKSAFKEFLRVEGNHLLGPIGIREVEHLFKRKEAGSIRLDSAEIFRIPCLCI